MTISEAYEYYVFEHVKLAGLSEKTGKNYTGGCRSFVAGVGDLPIAFIDEQHVIRWKTYLLNTGKSTGTIAQYLRGFRMVIRFFQEKGAEVIDPKTITTPKVIRKDPTYLYSHEIETLIEAAPTLRDKAIVACLFSTGCRISELLGINREGVRERENEVMVHGKNGSFRPVYIGPEAMAHLTRYLDTRTDVLRPLFVSGQRRRVSRSTVQKMMHIATDVAGIDKNVTPHTLRHSYATDLIINGADISGVSKLMGHSNIETTKIYTHLANPRMKELHARFHSKG